jgi:hypothetical protein
VVNPKAQVLLGELQVARPPALPAPLVMALLSVSAGSWGACLPIIEVCRAQKILPQVHAWDREKAWPQFTIAFVIPKPDHEMLCRMLPAYDAELRSQNWDEFKLLFTVGIERQYVNRFCAEVERSKQFGVLFMNGNKTRLETQKLPVNPDTMGIIIGKTIIPAKPHVSEELQ